jgi:23S rRNA (uracil1939-C5)-methyltransferase
VILGKTFIISPQSFFQTNTEQAENLFKEVLLAADPKPEHRVLDLFCGSGVIGLLLADRVREVVGYEIVESAIADAKRNAHENGITNARFVLGDVAQTLPSSQDLETIDLLIVDPPRAGIPKAALQFMLQLAPARIVYVSCNVRSAAPELAVLLEAGYRLERVQPLDLFPHTPHVECVFTLTR